MNHQHAAIEREDDELAVAFDRLYELIANPFAKRRKFLAHHVMRGELRVNDAAASKLGRERSNDGLNFRQLRHESLLEACLGVDENIVAVGFDLEAIQLHRGIAVVLTGSAVISPFMPGTDE